MQEHKKASPIKPQIFQQLSLPTGKSTALYALPPSKPYELFLQCRKHLFEQKQSYEIEYFSKTLDLRRNEICGFLSNYFTQERQKAKPSRDAPLIIKTHNDISFILSKQELDYYKIFDEDNVMYFLIFDDYLDISQLAYIDCEFVNEVPSKVIPPFIPEDQEEIIEDAAKNINERYAELGITPPE